MVEVKIKKLKFFFIILCVIQLFYIFHFRSGFKYEIIKNPFDENSGISHALSPEVIESKLILKKQKVIDFNLSKSLKKDTYFYQRSIEFNYPIRINEISRFVFFLNEEHVLSTCKVIETGKHIKLAQC